MNFFNIGPGEFFLMLVVALLVFGPERLPEVARRAGKAVRDLRNMVNNLDPELLEDWREVTRDLDSVREEMQHIRSDVVDIQKDLSGAAKEISSSVTQAAKDASATVNEAAKTAGTGKPALAGAATPTATTTSPGSATATRNAATPAATATGKAAAPRATTPARTSPVTTGRAATAAKTAAGPVAALAEVDSGEEIVGVLLTRGEDGEWHQQNEIVGAKVLPVSRPAHRMRVERATNGDEGWSPPRSREAVMLSLVTPRPKDGAGRVRPPLMVREPRPRRSASERARRVALG